MTRRTFAAALGILPALLPKAKSAVEDRGQQLIQESLTALGGDNFLRMQDRLESGRAYTFYHERLSGLSVAKFYVRYLEPPAMVPVDYFGIQERQVLGKKDDISYVFSGGTGYEVTYRGARPLPDEQITKRHDSTLTNFLYILRQRLREPGWNFEAKGRDVLENQTVQVVDLYDPSNRHISVYISEQTHLPVLQRYMRPDPIYKAKIEELTRYSKYRSISGGVMWPFDVQRERDGEKIYQMFAESVTVGNHFASSLFELPGGITILKKET